MLGFFFYQGMHRKLKKKDKRQTSENEQIHTNIQILFIKSF